MAYLINLKGPNFETEMRFLQNQINSSKQMEYLGMDINI